MELLEFNINMEKDRHNPIINSDMKKINLEEIHRVLRKSLKLKKRIHRLNKKFNKNLSCLTGISKEIKADVVSVLLFLILNLENTF